MDSHDEMLQADAPDTVHPSLWRHAQVSRPHGLFEVTDRVYQVRGLDLSNMTIIEGDTGILIIDPLVYNETAASARTGSGAMSTCVPRSNCVTVYAT